MGKKANISLIALAIAQPIIESRHIYAFISRSQSALRAAIYLNIIMYYSNKCRWILCQ